jgi:hypothetical protein
MSSGCLIEVGILSSSPQLSELRMLQEHLLWLIHIKIYLDIKLNDHQFTKIVN